MRFVACVLLAATCWAEGAQAPDFRDVRWGMTLLEVQRTEQAEYLGYHERQLIYSVEVAGMPGLLAYRFRQTRLDRAHYLLEPRTIVNDLWFEDFARLARLLEEKYGPPAAQEERWLNDRYRADPGSWALAVSVGDLRLGRRWVTDRTVVTLLLSGDEYKMSLGLEYADRASPEPGDAATALEDL